MVNIAEIVDKLPIGTKLYSTICGDCTIKKIYKGLGFDVISKDGTTYNFSYDGRFDLNGECCIFPSKENRDWNTFNKVENSFKPEIGDVVADCCDNVFIYQDKYSEYSDNSNFVVFTSFHNDFFVTEGNDSFQISKAVRYATAKEEELLFDIMDKNGYVYNELNNCISKKHKFKIGNRIKQIKTGNIYEITKICSNCYITNYLGSDITILFNRQDEYELVPNKFDISNLKPFDKILVKSWGRWGISHFGYFDNGIVYTENEKWYKENVLPYNDATKHLIGSCDDYDGFYKWW